MRVSGYSTRVSGWTLQNLGVTREKGVSWKVCDIYSTYALLGTYCIAGNFWGRKLSRILRFCGYLWIVSPQNLGTWYYLAGPASNLWKLSPWKSCFPPVCKSFLLRKFPAIQYIVFTIKCWFMCRQCVILNRAHTECTSLLGAFYCYVGGRCKCMCSATHEYDIATHTHTPGSEESVGGFRNKSASNLPSNIMTENRPSISCNFGPSLER